MAKLGAELQTRARQANRLDDLRDRATTNALTQEGTEPAENAHDLLEEFETVSSAHSILLARIARTNQATEVEYRGLTISLAELIHIREHKRRVRNLTDKVATAATPRRDSYRYMQSELKFVPMVNVKKQRERADALDAEIQEIDAILQEVNWKTDVLT